jgi:hypothetical protein
MLHVVGCKGQGRPQVVLRQLRVGFEQSANERPAPSLRKISSTVLRVPLMHGLPIMTTGSAEMRACGICFSLSFKPRSAPYDSGEVRCDKTSAMTEAMRVQVPPAAPIGCIAEPALTPPPARDP